MRHVLIGTLFSILASQSPAAVRAVIPGCCDTSGSLSILNPSTGAIEHTFATGSATAGIQTAEFFAIANGGKSAAVVSVTQSPGYVDTLSIVDLATGKISRQLTLPLPGVPGYTIAANPKINVIYLSYLDAGSHTHIQSRDPFTLAVNRDTDLGALADVVGSIVASPDGQTIYLSCSGRIAAVSTSTLKLIGTIPLPPTPAGPYGYLMAVSPDSSTLYAVYGPVYGQTVAFIDTKTLQVSQTVLVSGALAVYSIGVSPDGSQLYMPGEKSYKSGSTLMLTLDTGTLAISPVPIPIQGTGIAVSPNGLVYVAGNLMYNNEAQLVIFDPTTQAISATAPILHSGPLAMSSDGSQVFCLNTLSSSLAVAEAPPSETILHTASMGLVSGETGSSAYSGAYDRKDNLLLLRDYNGNVDVIDAATLRLNGLLYIEGLTGGIVFGEAGYATATDTNPETLTPHVVAFDPVSLQVTGSVALLSGYPNQFFGQPVVNGNRLYVPFKFSKSGGSNVFSGIDVIDTTEMKLLATWTYNAYPAYLAVSPDGKQGYVLGMPPNFPARLAKISMSTGQVLQQIQLPSGSQSNSAMALSPDGGTIYFSLASSLYAVSAQTLATSNSSAGLELSTLSVSPDGQYLYGLLPTPCVDCSTDYTLDIISTSTLQVAGSIPSAQQPGPVLFIGQ